MFSYPPLIIARVTEKHKVTSPEDFPIAKKTYSQTLEIPSIEGKISLQKDLTYQQLYTFVKYHISYISLLLIVTDYADTDKAL